MADFTKAGMDRGDIEAELKNLITSANITIKSYLISIDDLTPEEISYDYEAYLYEYKTKVKPKVTQALEYEEENIKQLAYQYEKIYLEFLRTLEEIIKKR